MGDINTTSYKIIFMKSLEMCKIDSFTNYCIFSILVRRIIENVDKNKK